MNLNDLLQDFQASSQSNFVRTRLPNELLKEINGYIEWRGLQSVAEFFEKAATSLLIQDQQWVKHKKTKWEDNEPTTR